LITTTAASGADASREQKHSDPRHERRLCWRDSATNGAAFGGWKR
jgi:hypothetical protein